VCRNGGHATQRRIVETARMNGQKPVERKNAEGTSGVAEEKGTPSASPSRGFVTTGLTATMALTRWFAQEPALLRNSPAKMDSASSRCGGVTEKATAEMEATRKIVQLLSAAEERSNAEMDVV